MHFTNAFDSDIERQYRELQLKVGLLLKDLDETPDSPPGEPSMPRPKWSGTR